MKRYMTTLTERLSYWSYFVGQNVYYNITFLFLSTYLAMQGIDLGKVALVLAAVKIWDAVNDPIFGYIFDKVKFKSGLKGLPWVRISVIGIPFVTIAVFAIPQASETVKLVWFAVAYLLWDTVYTLTDVPAYSMLNTMTDDLAERNLLLSVNRVFSGAGYLLCSVALPLMIGSAFKMTFTAAVAVLSVFSALALALLGRFRWVTVEAESFEELAALGIRQPDMALNGLWIVYALVPVIGMIISTFFYLGYKLNDKDVQIMAKCNAGEISREEAEARLSRKY